MKHTDAKCGLFAAATFALLTFWSCSDEPITGKVERGDNSIQFSSQIKANSSKSRSSLKDSKYESFNAEKISNSNMFLLTMVEDGIDATKLASFDEIQEEEETKSRGTKLNVDNIGTLYNDKGVTLYAYRYENKTSYNGKQLGDTDFNFSHVAADNAITDTYIENEYLTIERSGDSSTSVSLTPQQRHYWTSDQYRLHFFGVFPSPKDYAPNNGNNYNLTFTNGYPKLHIVIDPDVTQQRDVLCGQADCNGTGTSSSYAANLGLKHIMCGVAVELQGDDFEADDVISYVGFTNSVTGGSYDLATETWDEPTSADRGVTAYTAPDQTTAGKQLTSDNNLMFMAIPQVFGDDSNIVVRVYNKTSGKTSEFTQSIKGNTWPMGKTIKYVISNIDKDVDYIITSEFDTMYFSWKGTAAGDGDKYYETVNKTDDYGNVIKDSNGNIQTEQVLRVNDLGATRVKSYKITTDSNGSSYDLVPWTYSIASGQGATDVKVNDISQIASDNVDGNDYVSYTADELKVGVNAQRYNYKFKVNIGANPGEDVPSDDAKKLKAIADASGELGSSSSPIDLSYYTFSRNGNKVTPTRWTSNGNVSRYSANSYMVCCPGYYEIPVVYGNGIFADATNEGAFMLGTTGLHAAKRLVDRLDYPISAAKSTTSSWIEYWTGYEGQFPKNNGRTTNKVKDTYIVWQDSKDLVTIETSTTQKNWTTYSSEYYIRFRIKNDANTFKPGNAVIGVIGENGETLWSYHIWVTPRSTSDTFTADANKKVGDQGITFLEVPLGYVQEPSCVYSERDAVLTLTQTPARGKSTTIKLIQRAHTCSRHSCTYYQWGRKDPFPGAVMYESGHMYYDDRYEVYYTPKTVYDDNGVATSFKKGANKPTTLGSGIQNPFTFYVATDYSGGGRSNRFPDNGSDSQVTTKKTTDSRYGFNLYDLWGCTYNDQGTSDPAAGKLPEKEFGTSSRKTVYDPCPPGFKVPPILYMPAVTWTGENHNEVVSPWSRVATEEKTLYSQIVNTPFKDHNDFINAAAFKFYCTKMTGEGKKNDGGQTFSLYAMGGISNEGEYTGIGTECLYWTCTNWAARWSQSHGIYNHRNYYFHVGYSSKSTFEPVTGNTESFGYAIMPMKGN